MEDGRRPLLFIGRVAPEKGVHVLAEAFKIVAAKDPRAALRIVGPYAPPAKDFVSNLGDDAVVAKLA